jgi:hypothetical protein
VSLFVPKAAQGLGIGPGASDEAQRLMVAPVLAFYAGVRGGGAVRVRAVVVAW